MQTNSRRVGGSWAALAVVAAAAVLACAAGCSKDTDIIPLTPAFTMEARTLDEMLNHVQLNAARWETMTAQCNVIVVSPAINRPNNQAAFVGGVLYAERSGKINLTMPAERAMQIKLVSDGRFYSVEMPVFGVHYSGRVNEPPSSGAARIPFMPEDLAYAYNPSLLFTGRGLTARLTGPVAEIQALEFVQQPMPEIFIRSSVTLSRQDEVVRQVTRYDDDRTVRAQMSSVQVPLVSMGEGKVSVELPTDLLLNYYGRERASIRITLRDIKFNEELEPGLFVVRR